MSFYREISKYYDYIFPVGENQLNFIKIAQESPVGKSLTWPVVREDIRWNWQKRAIW